MGDSWAQHQRLDWIHEMLHIYGFINREHIKKKFWVSTPQASTDIKEYLRSANGRGVVYNKALKRYEREKD